MSVNNGPTIAWGYQSGSVPVPRRGRLVACCGSHGPHPLAGLAASFPTTGSSTSPRMAFSSVNSSLARNLGLILTPSAEATAEDDGFLTASEIATLSSSSRSLASSASSARCKSAARSGTTQVLINLAAFYFLMLHCNLRRCGSRAGLQTEALHATRPRKGHCVLVEQ